MAAQPYGHKLVPVTSTFVADSEWPCPVRVGEPCRLCVAGASGPADCGLVYLVRSDTDLAEQFGRLWSHGEASLGRTPTDPHD